MRNAYNQEPSLLFPESNYTRQIVLLFTYIFILANFSEQHLHKRYNKLLICAEGIRKSKFFIANTLFKKILYNSYQCESVFGVQTKEHSTHPTSFKLLQKEKVHIPAIRKVREVVLGCKCNDCTATGLTHHNKT